jgi:transcriptional regulator with XRE-family HTH domain
MITRKKAKVTLKTRGWNQRQAACHIGITEAHLSMVLNGVRDSKRLMMAIESLPFINEIATHRSTKEKGTL